MKAARALVGCLVLVVAGLAPEAVRASVCCSSQFSEGRLQAGGVKGAATWRYNPNNAPAGFAGATPPAAFTNAVATWNNDPGSTLAFTQGANTTANCNNNNDNINTIGWRNISGNAVAFKTSGTAVSGVETIEEFDICFDTNKPWLATNAPSVDLEGVALHEFGHTLGLNHVNANFPNAIGSNGQRAAVEYTEVVMAAFQNRHAVPLIKRTLSCDDKAGATFVYPPLDPQVNEFRDYAEQNTIGCDFGDAADPGEIRRGRYPSREAGEDRTLNGTLDPPEGVYRDNNSNGTVSPNDTRLSVVGALTPGNIASGAADVGTSLFVFQSDERHVDLSGGAANTYDAAEPIYRDNDSDGDVSVGDVRLLPPACLGQGSVVRPGDSDDGATLVAFNSDEKHDNRSGDSATLFDPGEDRYPNNRLDGDHGARHRDSRMEWLGSITLATGTSLPENSEMTPTYTSRNPVLQAPSAVSPWSGGVVAGQVAPESGISAVQASATFEPLSKQVNDDELDNGVSLRGPLVADTAVLVDILVNTNGLATSRYDTSDADKRLYLNAWEDWNGDGDWDDWEAPGTALVMGSPLCQQPNPSDEYVLYWSGTPGSDEVASANFCGGTAIGSQARVLTFWITPPSDASPKSFYGRYRLDYGEDVGKHLRTFTSPSLNPTAQDLDPKADGMLGVGFSRGEAVYGEVEDYVRAAGACCSSELCSLATESECDDVSGSYLGDETDCSLDYSSTACLPILGINPPFFITDQIIVADTFTIADVTVDVVVTHPWIGDLDIALENPNLQTVTLWNRLCGNTDDLDFTFDDDGTDTQCTVVPAPEVGSASPTVTGLGPALSTFSGSATGAWTLAVADALSAVARGTLDRWSLHIDSNDAICPILVGQQTANPLNLPPNCDAAGPYFAECGGSTTNVQLDGSGSSDPEGASLTFAWTTDCPGSGFDDPTSPTPSLDVASSAVPAACNATLGVDDGGNLTVCSAEVVVTDGAGPVISAPQPLTVECSASGGASASDAEIASWLASASASDACGTVNSLTDDAPAFFPFGTTTVTFTATDDSGNATMVSSTLTIDDTTPPVVTCSSASSPEDDESDDSSSSADESGLIIIAFDAADACGPVSVSGIIEIVADEDDDSSDSASDDPTCSAIPVASGQLIEMDCGDGDCEVELEFGVLEIETGDAVLRVTADDESGNAGTCVVDLCGTGGGNRSRIFRQTRPSDTIGGSDEVGSFSEEPRPEDSSRGSGAGRQQPEGKSRNPKKDAQREAKQQRR